jgi:uncharacterized protein YbjT (DUF2867 family)
MMTRVTLLRVPFYEPSPRAERISQATGKTVRYVNVSPAERRQALLNAGVSSEFADALDERGAERRRCPESRVYLATHETLAVQPTSFAEFARRNAAVFRRGFLSSRT